MEEGERSTHYFYSLEKSKRADQTIHTLTKDNLNTISEPTYSFYKALYSAQPCDEAAREQFLSTAILKLPENACESCEDLITGEELLKDVSLMENNKLPGFDGFTTNLYKHFWPLLGEKLTCV